MNFQKNSRSGTMLLMLLVFTLIAIVTSTATTAVLITNAQGVQKSERSLSAFLIAESGVENALLRLVRDPSYTGETLTVSYGTATIVVSGTDPKTITVTGTDGDFIRTIQVVAGYTNNVLTVTSWKEIF